MVARVIRPSAWYGRKPGEHNFPTRCHAYLLARVCLLLFIFFVVFVGVSEQLLGPGGQVGAWG